MCTNKVGKLSNAQVGENHAQVKICGPADVASANCSGCCLRKSLPQPPPSIPTPSPRHHRAVLEDGREDGGDDGMEMVSSSEKRPDVEVDKQKVSEDGNEYECRCEAGDRQRKRKILYSGVVG